MVENGFRRASNFYEEVDERMSRESSEYPVEQAKYVGDWLEHTINNEAYIQNEEIGPEIEPGNVIGICGFNLAKGRQQQDGLNNLRREHQALRAKYNKLLDQVLKKIDAHYEEGSNKLIDINELLSNRDKCKCKGCQVERNESKCIKCLSQEKLLGAAQRRRELEDEVHNLRRELAIQSSGNEPVIRGLNERIKILQNELAIKDSKISQLSQHVETLSLELEIDQGDRLRKENELYKKINSSNSEQFARYCELFRNLESRLGKFDDQISEECKTTDKQSRELIGELFRLQVKHSKLKHLLDVETRVKESFQRKYEHLQQRNEELDRKLERQASGHAMKEEQILANDQIECDRLKKIITDMQVKCRDLEVERKHHESMLRSCEEERVRLKMHALKERSEIKESYQRELDGAKEQLAISEEKKRKLLDELQSLSTKLADSENEKEQMHSRLVNLQAQLDARPTVIGDDQYLIAIETLRDKIDAAEVNAARLKSDLDATKSELEFRRMKYDDLKRKYDVQSATLDSANIARERELNRLRIDLNYERYNRQVTVRGLENKLKSTLKELDFMKTRLAISNMTNIRAKRCKTVKKDLVDEIADKKLIAPLPDDKIEAVEGE